MHDPGMVLTLAFAGTIGVLYAILSISQGLEAGARIGLMTVASAAIAYAVWFAFDQIGRRTSEDWVVWLFFRVPAEILVLGIYVAFCISASRDR